MHRWIRKALAYSVRSSEVKAKTADLRGQQQNVYRGISIEAGDDRVPLSGRNTSVQA